MYIEPGQESAKTSATASDAIGAGAPQTERAFTIYRVGKLIACGGQMLCLVRTASPHAITFDIDLPFGPDAAATLEIGRERVTGALEKIDARRGRISFAEPIDVESLIVDGSPLEGGRRALPRVEIDAPVRIEVGDQAMAARVCDISTDGMKIWTDDILCVGDRVRVALRGLDGRISGTVRWCAGDYAGIEFVQAFPLARLNVWLAAQAGSASRDESRWSLPPVSKS
jgi:hypothetical protein